MIEFCDATDVFAIDGQRRCRSSDRKAGSEVGRAGVADGDAGCAKLDWNLTGCCKTSSGGRLTVISEPEVFHSSGKCVDEVGGSGD